MRWFSFLAWAPLWNSVIPQRHEQEGKPRGTGAETTESFEVCRFELCARRRGQAVTRSYKRHTSPILLRELGHDPRGAVLGAAVVAVRAGAVFAHELFGLGVERERCADRGRSALE